MPQTTYQDQSDKQALEGGLYDVGFSDLVSRSPGANVAQVERITVDTAANSTAYTVTINGVPISFTSDANATKEEIRDGLVAAINAEGFVNSEVTASNGPTTDTLDVTADTAGTPFTLTESDANLSTSTITANVTGNPVPFGRGLARGGSAGLAVLPSSTGFVFEGVSVNRAKALPKDNTVSPPETGAARWNEADAMTVMRWGRIWVIPEDAVAITDDVYVRHTQGAQSDQTPGRFRTDADGSNADQISNARWLTAAGAGELAVLEIFTPLT